MPDTNSKNYDPKQDYQDKDEDTARNRYEGGKSFDPTYGHGAEVNMDPEDQKPLPDDAYPADGDGEKA